MKTVVPFLPRNLKLHSPCGFEHPGVSLHFPSPHPFSPNLPHLPILSSSDLFGYIQIHLDLFGPVLPIWTSLEPFSSIFTRFYQFSHKQVEWSPVSIILTRDLYMFYTENFTYKNAVCLLKTLRNSEAYLYMSSLPTFILLK